MHAQTAQYFLFSGRPRPRRRWETLQSGQLGPRSDGEEMPQLLKRFGFTFYSKYVFLEGLRGVLPL